MLAAVAPSVGAQAKPRARQLGVPFTGEPGPLNAITDVAGVEVGHVTLIDGNGPGGRQGAGTHGRDGDLPRGKTWQPVFAGWFAGNGFGEMTGAPWVVEGGVLGGPVMITGTYSVGIVRDAVNSWFHEVLKREIPWHQPVVGETSDAFLNDGLGQHITKAHVFQALDAARTGPVAEGNVGGGTGMVAHGFKGGIGTASRRVAAAYMVGVLVQANYGTRESLTIAGVPVGREIRGAERASRRRPRRRIATARSSSSWPPTRRCCRTSSSGWRAACRWASRGSAGRPRMDPGISSSPSRRPTPAPRPRPGSRAVSWLPNGDLTPFFDATVQATEEAIVNALVAAETMTGINGNTAPALPTDQLRAILTRYNRLAQITVTRIVMGTVPLYIVNSSIARNAGSSGVLLNAPSPPLLEAAEGK